MRVSSVEMGITGLQAFSIRSKAWLLITLLPAAEQGRRREGYGGEPIR
jgi:hypothetical protein